MYSESEFPILAVEDACNDVYWALDIITVTTQLVTLTYMHLHTQTCKAIDSIDDIYSFHILIVIDTVFCKIVILNLFRRELPVKYAHSLTMYTFISTNYSFSLCIRLMDRHVKMKKTHKE